MIFAILLIALCFSGGTSQVQYQDQAGNVWTVTTHNVFSGPESNDLLRQRITGLHEKTSEMCNNILLAASPQEKVYVDEEVSNNVYELTGEQMAEVFERYTNSNGRETPQEVYRYCLEWMRSLKGFDPPDNPHAQSQRRPAQLTPSEVRAMPLSDYRALLNAQYYGQQ